MSFLTGLLSKFAGGTWLWIGAASVVMALLAAIGTQTVRLNEQIAGRATDREASALREKQWATESASAVAAAASEAAQYRALEQQRATEREGIIHDATQQVAVAQAAAASATSALGRLSNRANALASTAASCGRTASDPPTASGSSPALGSGLVLAHVLERVGNTSGQLAAYADSSRIAGLACERAYDSLTTQ